LHGFIPVFIGSMIYVIWRGTSLLMFRWFDYLHLTGVVATLRNLAFEVPEWVIYNLPNGLWSYSFLFILTYIWFDSKAKARYLWMSLVPLLSIGSELGQFFGFIPGTFDVVDLIFYMLFMCLSVTSAVKVRGKEIYFGRA